MQHWSYLPTPRRVINRIKGQGQNRAGGELDLVEAEVDSIDKGWGSSVERNNAVDELEEQFTHKNNHPTSTTIHPSDPDFVSVSPTQVCVCLSYHCFIYQYFKQLSHHQKYHVPHFVRKKISSKKVLSFKIHRYLVQIFADVIGVLRLFVIAQSHS